MISILDFFILENVHPIVQTRISNDSLQCAPAFSNTDQKVYGLFHFYVVGMYEIIQNQLKKISVIGLPKFTIVIMVEKCRQHECFIEEMCFLKITLLDA